MKISNILKSNWIYVVFFVFYFLIVLATLGFTVQGFLIVLAIYGISITIALIPIGEKLMRAIQGVRRISTREEREYIYPIFEEVYRRAKETTPNLSNKIEIFMTDEMHINAYAFGKNTVVVTRGLIETMDEEQVIGILAHEFGHIVHGHTVMLLLSVIGNGIFSVLMLISQLFMFIIEMIMLSIDNSAFGRIITVVVHHMFKLSLIIFMYFSTIILAINSRRNEYQADKYAFEIGFGDELLQGLYTLHKTDMGKIGNMLERLTASHPHLAYRIERLEKEMMVPSFIE